MGNRHVACWREVVMCVAALGRLRLDRCDVIDITCDWNIYNDRFVDEMDVSEQTFSFAHAPKGGSSAHS